MKDLNIKYDFVTTKTVANQPVAVMPAALAVKVLKIAATQMLSTSADLIAYAFIDDLKDIIGSNNNNEVIAAMSEAMIDFIAERELCQAIYDGNLNHYEIGPNGTSAFMQNSDVRIIGKIPLHQEVVD